MRAIAHIVTRERGRRHEQRQPPGVVSSKDRHDREAKRNAKPIPRDVGAPFIGHLPAFRNDRAGLLARLAETHTDIVDMPMGFVRHLVTVTSPTLANEVLVAKQASFSKSPGMAVFFRPVLGNGLLTSESPFHERQRKLLAPAFAHKRVAAYATTMADRSQKFAEAIKDSERLDLADAMMRLTFDIVGKALFDTEVAADAARRRRVRRSRP